MEGNVKKRGKRIGARVKRFMRLEGTMLSNHHTEETSSSWTVNILHASVTANIKKKRFSIEISGCKLTMMTDTAEQCEAWYEALVDAKATSISTSKPVKVSKQTYNSLARPTRPLDEIAAANMEDGPLDEILTVNMESIRNDVLQSRLRPDFRVVKPISNHSKKHIFLTEQFEIATKHKGYRSEGPKSKHYEDTPVSMIFKEFSDPAKIEHINMDRGSKPDDRRRSISLHCGPTPVSMIFKMFSDPSAKETLDLDTELKEEDVQIDNSEDIDETPVSKIFKDFCYPTKRI